MALGCSLAGAALGHAQAPVSPYANPIDDQGRYMCPSPGGGDGIAQVITAPAPTLDVTEISGGVAAQENTFTPNSDLYKRPMPLTVNMRGKSASWDIDLGNPTDGWINSAHNQAFVVGIGATAGSAGPSNVVIEARYTFYATDLMWHAEFRLRTTSATGAWMDAGAYDQPATDTVPPYNVQVRGTYRVRLDISTTGASATMTVSPAPYLIPLPTGVYLDVTDTENAAQGAGKVPFISGFWSAGTPGTACGAARIVRASTNAGDELVMWLKSVHPFMTTPKGVRPNDGCPGGADEALLTNEFHLGVSNFNTGELIRGFQAFGHYFTHDDALNPPPSAQDCQWVWDYSKGLPNPDTTTFYDQSYVDHANGPFQYIRSRFVFNSTLWDTIEGPVAGGDSSSHQYFRFAAGDSPGTESLNSDAEILSLPISAVLAFPDGDDSEDRLGQAGGAIMVPLNSQDPVLDGAGNPILGYAGFSLDGGNTTGGPGNQPQFLRGSDTVIVDEVRPFAGIVAGDTCTGISEGTVDLDTGDASAFEGTVSADFVAKDNGNGCAPTGSGLGCTPRAVLEYSADGGVTWTDLTTGTDLIVCPSACGDNHFHAQYNISNCTKCGDYRIEFQVCDRVGLINCNTDAGAISAPFHVQTLKSITVTLKLDTPANNQRLIEFELGSKAGTAVESGDTTAPKVEIYKLVRFIGGVATVTLTAGETSTLGGGSGVIPSCDAENLTVWAKDEQHTLASAATLNGDCTVGTEGAGAGGMYAVTLTLLSGDNTNDNVVNFADYAWFVNDFSNNAPADMTSYIWYRNSDFNGNGQVSFADWLLFYPNYGKVGATEPGQFVFGNEMTPGHSGGSTGDVNIHDPHLTRMPVRQMVRMGLVNAPQWDLNHDGWVDMSELYRAMYRKSGGR